MTLFVRKKSPSKRPVFLTWPVFVIGFAATLSQIVFLRELMVVFSGNELSLAIVLASWLFWTSLGSGVLEKILPVRQRPERRLAFTQMALAVLLPASLVFIRASLTLFHRVPGEIPGLMPIFWISLLSTGPFCLLSGWAFALSGNFLTAAEKSPADSAGKVYFAEAAGAALGGFLVSLFLLKIWNSAEILGLAACFEFLSGALLLGLTSKNRLSFGIWILFALSFWAVAIFETPVLQRESLILRWKNQTLLTSQNTIYQKITLTRLGEQTNFYQNGLLSFSVPDPLGAEEATQFALLEHPAPQQVLLIGGGLGGQLPKILAHPTVRNLDYVELDPVLVKLGKRFVPGATKWLHSPKIHVEFCDARLFLRRSHTRYDVIILNAPPPYTAQLNRLYTREFFTLVSRHLKKGGVFTFALPSSENFIDRDLALLLTTFRQTLRQAFPQVLLLPGSKAHFLASNEKGVLTDDYHILVSRLQTRGVRNLFISPYYLPYRLSPERLHSFHRQLDKVPPNQPVNTDFRPLAYYYDILLWSTYFFTGTRNFLRQAAHLPRAVFPLACVGLYFLLFLGLGFKKKRLNVQVGLSIFTIGFTEITLEVLLILAFQLIYGYAYYWLSLIVTFFMGGLALGAGSALHLKQDPRKTYRHFRWVQFAAALVPFLFIVSFTGLHGRNVPVVFVDTIFALLAVGGGFLGGFQFPLGNRLFRRGNHSGRSSWGTLYSLDLLGAVFGALSIATLILPLFGLIHTLLLLSLANGLTWATLLVTNEV